MGHAEFVQTKTIVPPGGVWYFRFGDDSVATPMYDDAVVKVAAILEKYGIADITPQEALADYMCPHMPQWFCRGRSVESPVITASEARAAAEPYFSRQVVPVDDIMSRMDKCTMCPKHRKDFCLHCEGHDQWIEYKFGGHRPVLPSDNASGCCTCAGTFEAVVASVSYNDGEELWEGVPDTCWRRNS